MAKATPILIYYCHTTISAVNCYGVITIGEWDKLCKVLVILAKSSYRALPAIALHSLVHKEDDDEEDSDDKPKTRVGGEVHDQYFFPPAAMRCVGR
jgi:hypothetical protein